MLEMRESNPNLLCDRQLCKSLHHISKNFQHVKEPYTNNINFSYIHFKKKSRPFLSSRDFSLRKEILSFSTKYNNIFCICP